MREILFRGKRADNGEWVEGAYMPYYYSFRFGKEAAISTNDDVLQKTYRYPVDPTTVGQYTGLTDKKGKKIFEGDIVKNKFNIPNKHYVIKYDSLLGAFIGEDGSTMHFTTFDGDSELFEVIGNIHDNPELLKGAQE